MADMTGKAKRSGHRYYRPSQRTFATITLVGVIILTLLISALSLAVMTYSPFILCLMLPVSVYVLLTAAAMSWNARQDELVLSDEGLHWLYQGVRVQTTWDNLQSIETNFLGYGLHVKLASRAAVNFPGWMMPARLVMILSGSDPFTWIHDQIPLMHYANISRSKRKTEDGEVPVGHLRALLDTPLGQDIYHHAPHLFGALDAGGEKPKHDDAPVEAVDLAEDEPVKRQRR